MFITSSSDRYGWRQKSVSGGGWHFEEYCKLIDEIYKY